MAYAVILFPRSNLTWLNTRYSCIFEVPWLFKMCHLSVINLSENCQLCKSVRKLSIMCQKTVSNLLFSKICQKSVGKVQKIYQKSVSLHKCVIIVSTCCTKLCHKTVIFPHSDTFLTHFHHQISTCMTVTRELLVGAVVGIRIARLESNPLKYTIQMLN